MVLLEISQNSQESKKGSLKKETLAQVLSCEFCEICKNAFLTEQLWTTASEQSKEIKHNWTELKNVDIRCCLFFYRYSEDLFVEGGLGTVSSQFRDFPEISYFLTFLSLKSFGNL